MTDKGYPISRSAIVIDVNLKQPKHNCCKHTGHHRGQTHHVTGHTGTVMILPANQERAVNCASVQWLNWSVVVHQKEALCVGNVGL